MSRGFTIHMPHFPIPLVRSKVKVVTLCILCSYTDTNLETTPFRFCLAYIFFFQTVSTIYAFKSFRDSNSLASLSGLWYQTDGGASMLISNCLNEGKTCCAECVAESLFLLGVKATLKSYLANDLYLGRVMHSPVCWRGPILLSYVKAAFLCESMKYRKFLFLQHLE